ncbi:MAG: acetyl-CoA hydrolase/transferase C-terminal domain-containing protein [Acidilobaceae archaeon]
MLDELRSRVKDVDLMDKVMDAEDAVKKFVAGSKAIAISGMTGTGYPKVVPMAMSEYVERTGEKFDVVVYGAGTVGVDLEEYLSRIGVRRRFPIGASAEVTRKLVNSREFEAYDMWLTEYSRWLRDDVLTRRFSGIDIAIVEATGVTEEGLVLGTSVDASPVFIEKARGVIVELSLVKPYMLGLHDIYVPKINEVIPVRSALDRIGDRVVKIPKSKVVAVVPSTIDDQRGAYSPGGDIDRRVVENIIDFLSKEASEDPNLRTDYVTLQPAAGPIASLLADRIHEIGFSLSIWGEVASVRWLKTLSGNVKAISGSAIYTLPGDERLREEFYENIDEFEDGVVLRPQAISNSPEIISRFYHINVQQAIEVDVYGQVNITYIGDRFIVGVGGSGDHAKASYITIVALPSITGSGLSRVVPLVYHVDLVDHDVDIIVTDQGWADLRGLSPLEKARAIIEECAHPSYKDMLWDYLETVVKKTGHRPVDLRKAVEFREKLFTSG